MQTTVTLHCVWKPFLLCEKGHLLDWEMRKGFWWSPNTPYKRLFCNASKANDAKLSRPVITASEYFFQGSHWLAAPDPGLCHLRSWGQWCVHVRTLLLYLGRCVLHRAPSHQPGSGLNSAPGSQVPFLHFGPVTCKRGGSAKHWDFIRGLVKIY